MCHIQLRGKQIINNKIGIHNSNVNYLEVHKDISEGYGAQITAPSSKHPSLNG